MSVCSIHLGRASDGVDSVGYRQTGGWWPPPAENSCSFPLGSHCPELGSGEGRPVAAAVWHVQCAGHRISILILINTTQAWTQSHKTLTVSKVTNNSYDTVTVSSSTVNGNGNECM